MRVLVTGSAGFIGSHLVSALLGAGHAVIGVDLASGQDVADGLDASDASVIVHLAATCSTPGSVERPMQTFRNTVQTTAQVMEAARQHGLPVLLTSSVKARDGRTPYGAAKRMSELWAAEYSAAYDLPLVINRPGTVYGPGQEGSPESGWVAWFLEARRSGWPVTIHGDGSQRRDLLHVGDYVRLLCMQLDHIDAYAGRTWDVGGGPANAVSVKQLADHLALDYSYGPPRYGDAAEYIGINDVPGWQPTTAWHDGLEELL